MNIIARVRNITFRPRDEWPVIATESATVGSLYSGFIIPLAAISPICIFLKMAFFTSPPAANELTVAPSLSHSLAMLATGFFLDLAMVWVAAFIIQKLAARFQSSGNLTQSLKLVAYSGAPELVAGVFTLLPYLGGVFTFVAAVYGVYLAYIGLPIVMHTPPDRRVAYFVIFIVVTVGLGLASATVLGLSFGLDTLFSTGTMCPAR